MPIYEYLCEACGRITEVMQKVGAPSPRSCSECGGRKLAKLVSRSAFQLKGGGWYADLYASRKAEVAAASSGGSTDSPGDTATAEGKPAGPPPGGAKATAAAADGAKPTAAAAEGAKPTAPSPDGPAPAGAPAARKPRGKPARKPSGR